MSDELRQYIFHVVIDWIGGIVRCVALAAYR